MQVINVESIEAVIVDLPLRRLQRFSALGTNRQSAVIILARSTDGVVGIGEAVTPGGPWWSGESVESIKLHIDEYLAPLVIGTNAFLLESLQRNMNSALHGNFFAKAGLEMALLDLIGKTLDLPVSHLLGGACRDSIEVLWPLATGDIDQEIAEAEQKIEARLHRTFKLKMGALPVDEDVRRATAIARALDGKATVRVDPNEMWNESTATWAMHRLQDVGIEQIEQPVPRWNVEAMARLSQRFDIDVMIDEGMCTGHELQRIIALRAADTVSLKVMKSGGLRATKVLADVAAQSGLVLYMGTFLETSIGTAANMQLCATLPELPLGGELIGPLLMAEDLCTQPARYRDFKLWLNEGAGIGATLDFDKLNHYRRDRGRRTTAVVSV
ncbi:MAG: muconate cycloisomerase family protein [Pseudomonadota bacterium]